jgi:hypothetical protein
MVARRQLERSGVSGRTQVAQSSAPHDGTRIRTRGARSAPQRASPTLVCYHDVDRLNLTRNRRLFMYLRLERAHVFIGPRCCVHTPNPLLADGVLPLAPTTCKRPHSRAPQ